MTMASAIPKRLTFLILTLVSFLLTRLGETAGARALIGRSAEPDLHISGQLPVGSRHPIQAAPGIAAKWRKLHHLPSLVGDSHNIMAGARPDRAGSQTDNLC